MSGTDADRQAFSLELSEEAAFAAVADPAFQRDAGSLVRVHRSRLSERRLDVWAVGPDDFAAVRRELASGLAAAGLAVEGRVIESKDALDEAYQVAVARIRRALAEARHETLIDLIALEGRRSARAFEVGAEQAAPAVQNQLARTGKALRWLIEVTCHDRPRGAARLDPRALKVLLANAMEALHLRTLSDALWKGMAEVVVEIDDGQLLAKGDGRYLTATWQFAADFGQSGLASYNARERELAATVAASEWRAMASSFEAEYGYRLDDLYATALEWSFAAANAKKDEYSATATEEDLISFAVRRRDISRASAGELVRSLVLRPNDRFHPLHFEFEPQRHTRVQSYVMRPLVRWGSRVTFGAHHLRAWVTYHQQLILTDRLPVEPGPLRSAMGHVAQRLASHFAASLAKRLDGQSGWRASPHVWQLGTVNLQEIGDIDVLAVHPESRTAFALEAKRMAPGLTPYDAWQELEQFHGGRKRHVPKHSRRVTWLQENAHLLDTEFGGGGSPWRVVGCIVTSAPMAGATVVDGPLPIVAEQALLGWLHAQLLQKSTA